MEPGPRGFARPEGPPPDPATRSHLLGLLGEGLRRPHHHVGVGVLVLGQVDAGDPLRRREGTVSARRGTLRSRPL